MLFKLIEKDAIIDKTLDWLSSTMIVFYHGTRLTNSEKESVLNNGLLPLNGISRKNRLIEALSPHPNWLEVMSLLDETLTDHTQNKKYGSREGQLHLTLSKIDLFECFDHYLMYGSEFDQNVACDLHGEEGMELLKQYGKPRIITCAVPGDLALKAAHPYFSIEELRARGDVPNLIRIFLQSWSYKLAVPSFKEPPKVDCGLLFREKIPPDWIIDVETLRDDEIRKI